jgi:capsular polysaccharide biosynthesis protein
MLIRISLILAIIAALGAGALNFFVVKDKLTTLVQDRDTQKSDKETAQRDLASTKKTLAATKNELSQTQQQLSDAQAAQKSAEDARDKAIAQAGDLSEQLAKTTKERDTANNDLAAYTATGFTSGQVAKLSHDLKDAQEAVAAANAENLVLTHKISSLSNELARFTGSEDYVVKLPADLKGKVVQVDPKWDFVVLNIGEDQGVLANGELLVNRNGKLVAKVIVSTIEKDRCIANVVPGWKLGDLFEGDSVIPAHPAS